MPLRAQVDGHWVVAPLVPSGEWRILAADLRAGRRLATLPCCGGYAYGRTSTQGLTHFVHQRREGCAGATESLAHLALKAHVARAVLAAGWSVEPEAVGADWRADILATPRLATTLSDLLGGAPTRPPWRVAIELQLSRIDAPMLQQRQARYARDRVRGCWLLLPSALGRRSAGRPSATGPAGWDDGVVRARLGLAGEFPAFALTNEAEPLIVANGRQLPLSDFIQALLCRRVRYVEFMRPTDRPLRLLFYEVWCPFCQARSLAHLVAGAYRAVCGARGPIASDVQRPGVPPAEFEPTLLVAVKDYLAQRRDLPLPPARVDRATDSGRLGFHCPGCQRPLPPRDLANTAWPLRLGIAQPVAELDLAAVPGLQCLTDQPHWCVSLEGRACQLDGDSLEQR